MGAPAMRAPLSDPEAIPPPAPDPGWSGRDRRMVSTATVLLGLALVLALPFVLSAGSEFFLPVTAAMVLSIVLAPVADLVRRTGAPNALASLGALLVVPIVFTFAALLILQPALALTARIPALARRVAARIDELRGSFASLARIGDQVAAMTGSGQRTEVVVATPSIVQEVALATPSVLFEAVFILLMTYFLLEARFRMRRRLLLERSDFGASLRAARVLRDVQEMVAAYISVALLIAGCIGLIVGFGAWAFGLESPVMWGGLAALLNLLPYFGPMVMTLLLAAFGIAAEPSLIAGLAPAACYLGIHLIEANVVTPLVLGRRLTLSPIAILAAMSYFSWIWGVAGIFLSVPLLLIIAALVSHLGRPNLIGFLFGEPLFAERPDPEPRPAADEPASPAPAPIQVAALQDG